MSKVIKGGGNISLENKGVYEGDTTGMMLEGKMATNNINIDNKAGNLQIGTANRNYSADIQTSGRDINIINSGKDVLLKDNAKIGSTSKVDTQNLRITQNGTGDVKLDEKK